MIFDPISAVVLFGAVGVSGLLKSRDDQILAVLEKKLHLDQPSLHRIVIDFDPKQVFQSSMSLSE
jgi:hypothetical protein